MVPSLVLVPLLLDFRADRIVLLQNTWRQVDTLRLLMGFREQRAKSNTQLWTFYNLNQTAMNVLQFG